MRPVLLFDLDGTLTDPREGIVASLRYALESVGAAIPAQHVLEECIGPPLHQTLHALLGGDARVDEGLRFFRERYGSVGLFENRLYDGIAEAMAALEPLVGAMFVATSKPHEYAVRIVDHFGLTRYFRAVHGSEMDGRRAEKRELLEHILREEALDRAHVVMIGDRRHDVAAARAVGVRSIGVSWGFGSAQELLDAGADVICGTVDDLLRHFRAS